MFVLRYHSAMETMRIRASLAAAGVSFSVASRGDRGDSNGSFGHILVVGALDNSAQASIRSLLATGSAHSAHSDPY